MSAAGDNTSYEVRPTHFQFALIDVSYWVFYFATAACFWNVNPIFSGMLFVCGIPTIFRQHATCQNYPDELSVISRAALFFLSAIFELLLMVIAGSFASMATMACVAPLMSMGLLFPPETSQAATIGVSSVVFLFVYAIVYEWFRRDTWPDRQGTPQ